MNHSTKNKFIIVAVITVLINVLTVYIIYINGLNIELIPLLLGSIFGWTFLVKGSLPSAFIKYTEFIGALFQGGIVTNDDDPRNIPPKVYIPILITIITIFLIACLSVYIYYGGSLTQNTI